MEIIYPTTIRHYEGCITKHNDRFQARIRTRNICKRFKTNEEAFEFIKNTNIENNFIIKNKIYKYNDYSEVELTKNKKLIIDNDDINKIQKILCFSDERYNTTYVRYRLKNQGHTVPKFIHNYIMNYTPINNITIDHINGNGLDNRKKNLRMATQSLQLRNQVRKYGKSKIRHIEYTKWNTFTACFKYEKKRYRKTFKTLEEAKKWLIDTKKKIIPAEGLVVRLI